MNSERLSSLDAFRGITIAGMILVNNPGSWQYVYPPLRHAEWHGWTATDLVFPFFLFIVGVSISLAVSKKIDQGIHKGNLYLKIFKRSLIIFALGILLHLIPYFRFSTMRIPGVLQRIALCYLFTALLYIHSGTEVRALTAFSFLAIYWLVMKFVPVPGFGPGILTYQGNLCSYLDNKLLAGHLYKPTFDPEGILSTLPAICTALLGTLCGDWLRSKKSTLQKIIGLFIGGIFFTALGLLLHPYFPINKQLWTSTFVLFTAGAAMLLQAVCYGMMDGLGFKKWAAPFLIFGTNAIAVYAGSILMAKFLNIIRVSAEGKSLSLKEYIYTYLLAPWAGPMNGSLIFAILFVLFWLVLTIPLHRKKIFIKI
jgi:predicted acyltransferase